MEKLYKVDVTLDSGYTLTFYEYGLDETNAYIDCIIRHQIINIAKRNVKLANKAELLDAAKG